MGGQYIGARVREWIRSGTGTFTLHEAEISLDLTPRQIRPILRRLIAEGMIEQVGARVWQTTQSAFNEGNGQAGNTVDTGAREAREAARAAGPARFEQIDVFVDGARLLRGDDGEFYRGYLTQLD